VAFLITSKFNVLAKYYFYDPNENQVRVLQEVFKPEERPPEHRVISLLLTKQKIAPHCDLLRKKKS